MAITLITPPNPSVLVITLAEAKEHLRVLHSDEDAYITGLIAVATQLLQDATHYHPIAQTWQISRPCAPSASAPIYLPLGPLASVTSITYRPNNEDTLTWPDTEYDVEVGLMGAIRPRGGNGYPTMQTGRLETFFVRFVVGFPTAAEVPAQVKHAIKIILTTLYWERGKEPPHDVIKRLMSGYAHPGSMVA